MAMDVTLRQLRAYAAVLEASSFSQAAKTMHLSQAALSGLIKELENRVASACSTAPPARYSRPKSARYSSRWRDGCSQVSMRRWRA